VFLDYTITIDHVLSELTAYADLVLVVSYCIVLITVIEDLPAGSTPDRPSEVGNNSKAPLIKAVLFASIPSSINFYSNSISYITLVNP